MTVRKAISETDGIYFITITCCRWLNLFDIANGYDTIYRWFDYLKSKGHYIVGYVIMPNHLHCLTAFRNTKGKSLPVRQAGINSIIGNGKRFMAYDIVARLQEKRENELLAQLASYVNPTDKRRGKLHEVFEPSFDCRECYTDEFIEQKLNYMHDNPCRDKWELAKQPWEYQHSSAKFYFTGDQGFYSMISYMELKDVDLTKAL